MSRKNMPQIEYFLKQLRFGKIPNDPFDNQEKEALRRAWNNRIAMHYGGTEKLKQRMLQRQALRALRQRSR